MPFKTFAAQFTVIAAFTASLVSASANEEVRFTSEAVKLSPFREKLAKQRGEAFPPPQGTPLIGFLSRPEGDGPFPAIVVMHGCGGLGSRLKNDVAGRFASQGYVVLVVDSFQTRQMKSTCQNTQRDGLFAMSDRVYDAYGALDFLSEKPFVDVRRVALMGFSSGGVTALEATKVEGDEQLMNRKFKAAVAYYPTCSPSEGDATVPTLIMVGELDDWGPPVKCQERLTHLSGKGPEIRLVVYPGAFHDFDVPTAKPGTVYFGHQLQYSASATAQAAKDVDGFLREELQN
ncbi:dienelactone hydrolase family protein [Agrobacterium vitis]|uniref:dienelactone hydrolase family protein n=1 Tax=Allorhizobium ampelinum TaxID=3025782 RepID=UPI001F2AB146|nr:dienelactone hydrolase family protein [Allorhizobium ampelinum]MCF1450181.1 dienelactone hydrolase family protein [Allorhizobium ampelinum]